MSQPLFSLFVSCAKGLEYLLEEELCQLGLTPDRVSPQGVYAHCELAQIYRVCLWTRLANRVQLIVCEGPGDDREALYQLSAQFAWDSLFSVDKTLAIEFHGESEHIRNTLFGAQVVKDAIVDYFQQKLATRPSIAREKPDIKLHAYLKNAYITLSLDLTGYSLHQRGYRTEAGLAPLKETVAAAMLMRAKWANLSETGAGLHDPFCGSGTLVIEAAMMSAGLAPGLLRNDQSLQHWCSHDETLWQALRSEALAAAKSPSIVLKGTDHSPDLIKKAKANALRAGVSDLVDFSVASIDACKATTNTGLLITNPPYGERLEDVPSLIPLYKTLGLIAHEHFPGWNMAVLTSSPELAKAIGLRAKHSYTLYNGALSCKLYCISLEPSNQLRQHNSSSASQTLSAQATMLANRLSKNYTHLKKWATRQSIDCYRIYDADLAEYNYAIDKYKEYIVLQEYVAPASISAEKVAQHTAELLSVLPSVLGVSANNLIMKQRKPQKGKQQYQKINQSEHSLVVNEGLAKFKVNLYDYLDTGLFLDHRLLRLKFAQLPKGVRFLNCYCYTATASVQAALAGAITTNIDLSNTYLNWGKDNFHLNQLNLSNHRFIQDDVLTWLRSSHDLFDVIFLDPPSFSNSKRMQDTLDIQRDHELLIHAAMRKLTKQGVLYFSTNLRRFSLASEIKMEYHVVDISSQTIDIDFKRNQTIHQCYRITSQS